MGKSCIIWVVTLLQQSLVVVFSVSFDNSSVAANIPQLFIDSKVQSNGYTQAIDIAVHVRKDGFRCLRTSGYSTALIRAYMPHGNGAVDVNCIDSIKDAANEGLSVEVYAELQPRGTKSGSDQFMEMYTYLTKNGITVKAIWMKITSPINWPNNQDANIKFINEFVHYAWKGEVWALGLRNSEAAAGLRLVCTRYGLLVGIYTNWYDWQQITAGWKGLSSQGLIRLWYWNTYGSGLRAASSASFNDFRTFGGFSTPLMKQYAQGISVCGLTTALSVYSMESANAIVKYTYAGAGSIKRNVTVGLLPWTVPAQTRAKFLGS